MNLKCDSEEVPELIQHLRYNSGSMIFEAFFFNGKSLEFTTDHMCKSVGLMQHQPTRMQMLEAENNINQFVIKNWRQLFPYLRAVS